MENRKIRYQLDRLPMVLFIACLAITIVAAKNHVKPQNAVDNLYSPFYFGDPNVTEGKQFWISCRAEPPIKWYKDGEPIEQNFLRYGKDEFTYMAKDREGLNGKTESTLSVTKAVLRHKGKYQCNINHENSHYLNVHPAQRSRESEENFAALEVEDDHEDMRTSFEPSFASIPATKVFTMFATEITKFDTAFESDLDYDDDKSREKFEDRKKDDDVTEIPLTARKIPEPRQNSPDSVQSVLEIFEERIPGQKVKEIIAKSSQPIESILETDASIQKVKETSRDAQEVLEKVIKTGEEQIETSDSVLDVLEPIKNVIEPVIEVLASFENSLEPSNPTLPTYDDSRTDLEDYDSTQQLWSTTPSTTPASFTNIPLHPTHAIHTHVKPSEAASTKSHLVQRHKGKLTGDPAGGTKVFKIYKSLGFSCTSDGDDTKKIVWSKAVNSDDKDDKDEKKGFKNVYDIGDLKGRFNVYKSEGKFVIDKTVEEDAGEYMCSLGDDSITFKAAAAVIVKVAENIYSIEDEKLEITCIVKGTEPKITWEFLPEKRNDSVEALTIDSDDGRYKLEESNDVDNAKLVINPSKLSDRGTYTCIGTNEWMNGMSPAKSESFLRVKDKLAALWPFLGICAEVFLLCAIILIYEKRRNKTEAEDSDTDQSPDQKHDSKDSDVRHRK